VLRGDGNNQTRARFQILGPLGAGGFGAVYEAVDARSGQHVALKQLDDTSADSIARFKQEFRALTECHHENLVSVKELIEQDGRWLIVMELVPGVDFLRHVRSADNDNDDGETSRCDEARLRGALVGILHGLSALHAFGIVHRDLKPGNVRVRPDGRAVLLDFGLATSVDPKQQSTHAMGVGTAVYMAPEQAGGQSISTAADMYALGVCLFEALTGEAPFESNNAIKILLDKQMSPARRPSLLVKDVPADLDVLTVSLLEIDPQKRPSAEEALAILSHAALPSAPSQPRTGGGEEFFAGRDAELSHLERALARTHEGELRVVLIEGESGVGKSELVSEFLRRMRADAPELWVLRGRCYENEQVSYKAFDGCIDELSKMLRRLDMNECRALLPERATLLGQLFPVLRNVKAIASAARTGTSADPSARRLEAFAALAQLLAKIAEERPLVLVLDDLQWADAESFRLLAALSEQNPRPPILLVGTVRPRDELDDDVREQLEGLRKVSHVDVVPVSGLPREQAKALTRKLFDKEVPDAWLNMIADESQGHPLFISELVQYTRSHDFAARGKLSLEAALRARLDRLERPARELLEIVALAARPHPSNVFAHALGVEIEQPARTLLAAKLLRQRRGDELGCYHDRIRHAVVDLIATSRVPALHYQLGAATEKLPGADPADSAHHWDLAGQPARASAAYEHAASRAFAALAFGKAAQLYARAIELASGVPDERHLDLTVKRAETLACIGRYSDAAALFQRAADLAGGETRTRLRSRAASYLMLSGAAALGLAVARELLRELGFSISRNAPLALLRYAWDSLFIAFASGRPTTAGKGQSKDLALSVLREMRRAITIVNPLAALVLGAQYVRRASRSGSPIEVSYGLSWRAWSLAARGSFAHARPLLDKSRALLMQGDPDHNVFASQVAFAGSTHAVGLDWPEASAQLQEAHELARQHCVHDAALLTTIRYHLGICWYMLGEHARIAQEVPGWLAEARERNDVLAIALLAGMGHGFVRHLLVDAPEKAIAELEASYTRKADEPYAIAQLGQFIGSAISLLYAGGSDALRYVERHREEHGRSFLLRAGTGLHGLLIFHELSLLSAYATASVKDRPELLRKARQAARALLRQRTAFPQTIGLLGLSQIAALEGKRELALAHVEKASVVGRDLPSHMQAAQYLRGLLEGGQSGQDKCQSVLRQYRAQGWQNPTRALNVNLPALSALLAQSAQAPERGTRLLSDRYEITGPLGSGGFGAVVSARDVRTGHVVALKELVRTGGTSIERFKREFRALSDVHHTNIVQLESLFEHQGRWYIAMELVEGTDLVSYVRASGACDHARLASTFLGLAQALEVLHAMGLVHRDVKPENVIVTHEGRPVLIDFGLVARLGQKPEGLPTGSVAYSSPEQLLGSAPSAQSDVYGLGACLFHALSGRAPFAHDDLSLPGRKRAPLPALPGHESMQALCVSMLSERPEERPTLSEVIAALGPTLANGLPSQRLSMLRATLDDTRPEWTFAGREQELARLTATFRAEPRPGLTLVLVEGESGLGKSALVSQFAGQCQKDLPLLRVLRGRCYENEQVPFKAFDRAIDQLAELLRALPEPVCEAILPKRAALLAQLFPVLGGVPLIERAGKKGLPADPVARKQAGRECFTELLVALSAERRLLLVIDDLQWADRESFDLLRALIAHGPALAPLCIVCTVRPKGEIEPSVLRELEALSALPGVSRITLGLLDERAGMQLARQLLGGERDPESLSALVQESNGHPLFLRELVEHERRGLGARGSKLTLDAALGARIEGLSAAARSLLELMAVLGKPYGVQVFERAFADGALSRDALVALLGQGLVQRRGDKLGCYHDRIRHVTLARLSSERRAGIARNLALALTRELRADPADKARLWDEAGEAAEAALAYELSGNQALGGLAFVHAEQDYARALVLLGDATRDARFQRLSIARGHALVGAGRSAEAARMFQQAAEQAEGEEKVRLRIWTAQHMIQSAQVEEGLSAATKLLSELGLSLPKSDAAAKARIVYERTRVKVRGIKLGQRRTDAHERLVLDALHGLSSPVRATAYLPGTALVTQYLRRALNAGDPIHSARALAYEALLRSISSATGRQDALFEQSRSLAEATSEPALMAEVDLMRGLSCVMQHRMKSAPTYLSRAHEMLQAHCPGEPGLINASRMYLGMAWFHSGEFQQLRKHMDDWLEDARARDDRYAMAALCGFGAGSFRHLLDDAPERGLSELDAAMARWPKQPFTTNHLGAFLTRGYILSCAQDHAALARLLASEHEELEHAYLMQTPTPRVALLWLRAMVRLRSIERPNAPGVKDVLREVRAYNRSIQRIAGPYANVTYLAVQGWTSYLEGDPDGALRTLLSAEQAATLASHYALPSIRYAVGFLEGGASGGRKCQEVIAGIEADGFRDFRRGLSIYIPVHLSVLGL
jgi:eukaryotic-like serine/threonine-protein kinase